VRHIRIHRIIKCTTRVENRSKYIEWANIQREFETNVFKVAPVFLASGGYGSLLVKMRDGADVHPYDILLRLAPATCPWFKVGWVEAPIHVPFVCQGPAARGHRRWGWRQQ
jgi:hypothetical protein